MLQEVMARENILLKIQLTESDKELKKQLEKRSEKIISPRVASIKLNKTEKWVRTHYKELNGTKIGKNYFFTIEGIDRACNNNYKLLINEPEDNNETGNSAQQIYNKNCHVMKNRKRKISDNHNLFK